MCVWLWKARLAVLCWWYGYAGEGWRTNWNFAVNNGDCWDGFIADGYTPRSALLEDASCN